MVKANSPSKVRVSVVVTVLNEAETVTALINALARQTLLPERVVITDGGSSDGTLDTIQHHKTHTPFELVSAVIPGNRSVGRNVAIEKYVKTPLVAITDAGCVPDEHWLQQLVETAGSSGAAVVAGYYDTQRPATLFQLAAAPFFLVMKDKVNSATFLPATRSMLLEKAAWSHAGGFDETLSDNEDYAFAHELKTAGVRMAFAQEAIVFWSPPKSVSQFCKTIFRFARGDVVAGLYRPKVVLVFLRYVFGIVLFCWLLSQGVGLTVWFVMVAVMGYSVWTVIKLGKYMSPLAWAWIPVLQVLADLAVLAGSMIGCGRKLEQLLPMQE